MRVSDITGLVALMECASWSRHAGSIGPRYFFMALAAMWLKRNSDKLGAQVSRKC